MEMNLFFLLSSTVEKWKDTDTIIHLLEAEGLSLDETNAAGDLASGRFDTWNRSSGRPFNYLFVNFSDVNAIRYLANWEVVGKAQMFSPNATYDFTLSLDAEARRLTLVLGFMRWTMPAVGGPIDVVNSQTTKELVVKFRERVYMDGGGWYMSEGSVLYVRDVD